MQRLSDMEIRDLMYLETSAAAGNFARAGKSLGINTSTISRRVGRFEGELGLVGRTLIAVWRRPAPCHAGWSALATRPGRTARRVRAIPPTDHAPSQDALPCFRVGHSAPDNLFHHPCGTCKIGVDDQAVVDPRLRVRGIKGLCVADASVMPQVVSANTNATCIIIGEKLADMVREDAAKDCQKGVRVGDIGSAHRQRRSARLYPGDGMRRAGLHENDFAQ